MPSCCHKSLRVSSITIASPLLCEPISCTETDFNYNFTAIASQPMLFSSQWTRLPSPKPSKQTSMPKQVHTSPLPHPFPARPLITRRLPAHQTELWRLLIDHEHAFHCNSCLPPSQLTHTHTHPDPSPTYHMTSPLLSTHPPSHPLYSSLSFLQLQCPTLCWPPLCPPLCPRQ